MSADITKPETWYEMKLGDYISLTSTTSLQRVPGGWLMYTGNHQTSVESFIPFNDEFLPHKHDGKKQICLCCGKEK